MQVYQTHRFKRVLNWLKRFKGKLSGAIQIYVISIHSMDHDALGSFSDNGG